MVPNASPCRETSVHFHRNTHSERERNIIRAPPAGESSPTPASNEAERGTLVTVDARLLVPNARPCKHTSIHFHRNTQSERERDILRSPRAGETSPGPDSNEAERGTVVMVDARLAVPNASPCRETSVHFRQNTHSERKRNITRAPRPRGPTATRTRGARWSRWTRAYSSRTPAPVGTPTFTSTETHGYGLTVLAPSRSTISKSASCCVCGR